MWKDFFYFTKTERQGIILLLVLIVTICGATIYLETAEDHTSIETDEHFKEEYEAFLSQLKEKETATRNYTKRGKDTPMVHLQPFDPNTADSTLFTELGLPRWMIKNILTYRKKKGHFRKPEDFKKIYGLTAEQYNTLQPYITIQATEAIHSENSLLKPPTTKRDTIFKYPVGTKVDLNKADTTELKKIPGIGSYIAHAIIRYRSKLGHYYSVGQLEEIHLIADKLRPWFTVKEDEATRLNLNKCSLEKLMRHPYINFYQAKAIVEYRRKKGDLKSLKQLALYEEFTPTDFERISHYVCF
ncbi:MAG: helix-hairpin-helix domain-containing protein [Bacteroidia bacterium]|nr:helix-hairpin-helix domain-containing protein [Bacteroidia bacterium]